MWWREEGYQFLDGDDNNVAHSEGPPLRHFRSVSMKQVTRSSVTVWDQLIEAKVELPTSGILLYDERGNPTNRVKNSTEDTSGTQDENMRE